MYNNFFKLSKTKNFKQRYNNLKLKTVHMNGLNDKNSLTNYDIIEN